MIRWLAIAAVLCLLPARGQAESRFALVLANEEGNAGHARLWYASQDADRIAQALTELGDFPREHVVVLHDSRRDEVSRALEVLEARITEAQRRGERTLLLLYFSGHADDTGLELGPDGFPYAELRSALMHSVANTRIAVVDACGAGTLTQVKGGRASAAVDFVTPRDEETDGFAFLASTAMGEPAQESSALQGSFFTRSLEAAIRGAGDLNGDGRVTLTEAFLYASKQTISATFATSAGPQHPTYETHLSGRGDVVLANLERAEAGIVLPPAPDASYVLRGPHQLVAEVRGTDRSLLVALPAGSYEITRTTAEEIRTARVSIGAGEKKQLPPMRRRSMVLAVLKGGAAPTEVSLGLSLSSAFMLHAGSAWSGRLAVSEAVGPVRVRVMAEGGLESVDDAGLTYQLASAGGAVAVLIPLLQGSARVEIGPQLGADWIGQQLESGRTLNALGAHCDAVGLVSYSMGAVRIGTELSAGVQMLPLNGVVTNHFIGGATLFAGLGFF